jgi:hypothetical protein
LARRKQVIENRPLPLLNKAHQLQTQVVCNRPDVPWVGYGETWAAYQLASTLDALAEKDENTVVTVGAGHGHVSSSRFCFCIVMITKNILSLYK